MGDNEDIPENVRDLFGKKTVIEVSPPNDQDFNTSDDVSSIAGDEAIKLQKVTTHTHTHTHPCQDWVLM